MKDNEIRTPDRTSVSEDLIVSCGLANYFCYETNQSEQF